MMPMANDSHHCWHCRPRRCTLDDKYRPFPKAIITAVILTAGALLVAMPAQLSLLSPESDRLIEIIELLLDTSLCKQRATQSQRHFSWIFTVGPFLLYLHSAWRTLVKASILVFLFFSPTRSNQTIWRFGLWSLQPFHQLFRWLLSIANDLPCRRRWPEIDIAWASTRQALWLAKTLSLSLFSLLVHFFPSEDLSQSIQSSAILCQQSSLIPSLVTN